MAAAQQPEQQQQCISEEALLFCRTFDINSTMQNKRAEKYTTIKKGCEILNELFARNIILVILQIAIHLNWVDIARASELVDFNLLSCLLTSTKTIKKIFYKNSLYSYHVKRFGYIKLNFSRLSNLLPSQLFHEYNIISRFPVFNIFDSFYITFFNNITDAAFHPTEQLIAIIVSNRYLLIYAYGKNSFFRNKCINTALLFQHDFCIMDVLYGLQWSQKGSYLSVFSQSSSQKSIAEWLPKIRLTTPKCTINSDHKYLFIIYLNSKTGEIQPVFKEKEFKVCKWKQSKYIWISDCEFLYYYKDSINSIVLNPSKKTFEKKPVLNKVIPSIFIEPIGNFTGMMVHPYLPNIIILVVTCLELFHFHHSLLFFDLTTKTIKTIFPVPGIISNIMHDTKKAVIVIRYYYFPSYDYRFNSTCTLNNSLYECQLSTDHLQNETRSTAQINQTLKNLYLYDGPQRNTTTRCQEFLQLDLTSMEHKLLLKNKYINIFTKIN